MTYWPKPEKTLAPEGPYEFRLNKEPELKKFTDRNGKESRRLIVYAIALGESGEYSIIDSFVPWEQRYTDLCAALGVEHGRDITMAGSIFKADIKHEEKKDKPGEFWARIANVVVPEDPRQGSLIPESAQEGEGDDIPF